MNLTTDALLALKVMRWARDNGWAITRHQMSFDGYERWVRWQHKELRDVTVSFYSDDTGRVEYGGSDVEVSSVRQAVDVLCALNVLPARFSSAFWIGQGVAAVAVAVEAGTAAAPREATGDEPDLEQMAIDRAVEAQLDTYWANVHSLLDDEKSEMWQAFADVVEKLQPDIGPWDKRELVAAIVAEFKAVIEDAS